MKTTGERIKHLREDLLRMTQQQFLAIAGTSGRTLSSIEQDKGGEQSIKDIIKNLGLSEQWVYHGKGHIFHKGTNEENIERIKDMKPGQVSADDPWKDEAFLLLKEKADREQKRADKLQEWIDRIMQGKVSFLKALGKVTRAKAA